MECEAFSINAPHANYVTSQDLIFIRDSSKMLTDLQHPRMTQHMFDIMQVFKIKNLIILINT